jgi:potassium large conductance calcium-activated channel subfamily M alpha protein 1
MRVLRTFKLVNIRMSAVTRQTVQLALTVTSIVFLSAGLLHLLEQELYEVFALSDEPRSDKLTFGGSVWFIIVTLSTVGYGDVVPETWLGQAVTAAFTVGAIVLIPMQVNRLTGLLALQSKFRTSFPRGGIAPKHVLLVGHVSDSVFLEQFLSEFYHPDRIPEEHNPEAMPHTVIFGPEEPTDEVQNLLLDPTYEARVSYIRGSVMQRGDLQRVAADEAEACFVLSNSNAENQALEDRATAVRTLVVKNFNPDLKVFVHILGGEALYQVQQSEVSEAVSIREWKTRLMAQSCLTIGFSTLVHNLLKSATVPDLDMLDPWVQEYASGAGLEIYSIGVPSCMDGLSFSAVAKIVYDRFDGEAIVWGVQEPPISRTTEAAVGRMLHIKKRARRSSGPSSILLSCSPYSTKSLPGRVYLNPGADFKVVSSMFLFVLAEDESIALDVADSNKYLSVQLPKPLDGLSGFSGRVGVFDRVKEASPERWMWSDSDAAAEPCDMDHIAEQVKKSKGWSILKHRVQVANHLEESAAQTLELRDPRLRAVLAAIRTQEQMPEASTEQMNFSSVLNGICITDVAVLDAPPTNHIVYVGSLETFADFLKPFAMTQF